jgi:hypothetical protein
MKSILGSEIKILNALPDMIDQEEAQEIFDWWNSLSSPNKQFVRDLANEWFREKKGFAWMEGDIRESKFWCSVDPRLEK